MSNNNSKSASKPSEAPVVKIDVKAEFVKALITGFDTTKAVTVGGQDKSSPRQAPRAGKAVGKETEVMPHGSVMKNSDDEITTDKKAKHKENTDKANAMIKRLELSIHDMNDMDSDTMSRRQLETADIIRSLGLPTADSLYAINFLIALGETSAETKAFVSKLITGYKVGSVTYSKDDPDTLLDPTIEILAFNSEKWIEFAKAYHALIKETFGMKAPVSSPAAKTTTAKASASAAASLFKGRTGRGGKSESRVIPSPEGSFDPTAHLRQGTNANRTISAKPDLIESGTGSAPSKPASQSAPAKRPTSGNAPASIKKGSKPASASKRGSKKAK